MGTLDIAADLKGKLRLTDLQITDNYMICKSVSHNLPTMHHGFDGLENDLFHIADNCRLTYKEPWIINNYS